MEGNKGRVLCEGTEQISLRNHQEETLEILKELDEKRESFSTIVNLPTGGGKTRIGIGFCLDVLKKGAKVLWIADRIPLLEQTTGAFREFKSDREYKCQFIWGRGEGEKLGNLLPETDIVFASVQTIANVAKKWEKSFAIWLKKSQEENRKLYIVYDEAHHIGASNIEDFFASLICRESYDEEIGAYYYIKKFGIIGLTATVYRGDRYLDAFNKWFKDGYDKKAGIPKHIKSDYGDCDIAYGEEYNWNRIAIVDIKELIDGYNGADPVLVEPEIIKISEYDKGMPGKEGKRNDEAEMKYLADRIRGNYRKWGATAVIVDTINKATILKDFLDKKGHPNTFILISESGKTAENVLKDFKCCKDDNKILIGVRMLDEGIDIPELETLYLYAPTMSQVVLRQRIGRVLRNPESKNGQIKEARVIWQHYLKQNERKYIDGKELDELLSKKHFNEKPETEEEMKQDIKEWEDGKSQGIPLPPAMYKEPLPEDRLSKREFYSEWQRLEIEKLFSAEEIAESDSIGFFYDEETFDSTDCVIYVRDVERKGYRQFLRVLQNDRESVLRYHDCKNFKEYAEALGVKKEEDLLDDIKQICFYLSDARKIDTSGHKLRKRILVRDEDIKTFCGWFLRGEIGYKRLQGISKDRDDTGQKMLKELLIGKRERRFMYSQAQNEKDKVKEKIKGFSCDLPSREGKKEYTDMLEYCGKYIYQDVMSVKSLLRMGVCDKKHRISDPNGHAEWAFVGKKEGEGRKEVKHINRRTKEKFDKEDWLLIASALVEMPDHIWVTQEDVDEYEKKLLENLKEEMETTDKERWENLDKEQLVKEFLMALGYCKNDAIIRRQCEIFGEDLPRIIQYILYERAYKELGGKVRFKGEDEKIHATCENKYELEKHYEEFLKRFGICADSMVKELTPVEDVIYDYRPYLKAVPYYQGIKPEFLCRMANSIVQGRKDAAATKRVIDAFGGSGACTMNGFYKEMKPEQVYNDLGIMNTAFYRCLKDEKKFKSLKKKVDKIIEKAFSDYDEDGKMGSFFSRFEKYLDYREKAANTLEKKKIANAKEMLEKSIKECEEAYVEDYGKKVSKCRSGKKEEELESYNAVWLENRLGAMHENYAKKLKMDEAGIENYKAVFRSIERYMHVFMLKLNALYLVLVGEVDIKVTKKWEIEDTDLAMLFLMYNSLTHRHFYNHCTIENIGKFMNSYQAGLEYGKEVFKSERVEVNQKNAIELLGDSKYNEENTVWYLDIPYAETSSADYVPDWFAIENFFERLSGCKGTYIVSSRCNICLPEEVKEQYSNCQLKKKQFDEEEDDNKELEGCIQKEWNVFTFYYSFLSEDDVKEYQDYFSEIKKENMVKELRHLPEDKKAKYILIPYTKMQEDYFVEDDADKAQTYSLEKNNSKATAEYVRRMLAATHNSNIPVEVMITNAELDFAAMHAQKAAIHVQETETGIYVMPTFKMGADGSQYMVEPLVIIMDYKKFMEQMLRLLYHEEWKKYQSDRDAAAAAQYFYKYFKKK